jgi:hypothetical protein
VWNGEKLPSDRWVLMPRPRHVVVAVKVAEDAAHLAGGVVVPFGNDVGAAVLIVVVVVAAAAAAAVGPGSSRTGSAWHRREPCLGDWLAPGCWVVSPKQHGCRTSKKAPSCGGKWCPCRPQLGAFEDRPSIGQLRRPQTYLVPSSSSKAEARAFVIADIPLEMGDREVRMDGR